MARKEYPAALYIDGKEQLGILPAGEREELKSFGGKLTIGQFRAKYCKNYINADSN